VVALAMQIPAVRLEVAQVSVRAALDDARTPAVPLTVRQERQHKRQRVVPVAASLISAKQRTEGSAAAQKAPRWSATQRPRRPLVQLTSLPPPAFGA